MVALSPRCCADLGIPLSEEDRKRPYVEVSGRKGLGVKADDLMDNLIAKALEEVASRHPERRRGRESRTWPPRSPSRALRYFLLKFTRNTVIAFDLQEALELRRRDRARMCNMRPCARATFCASWRSAASSFPTSPRSSVPQPWRGSSSSRISGRCCWPLRKPIPQWRARSIPASLPTSRGTPSNSRSRSAISTRSTRSSTNPIARRKVFLLWMTDFFRRQLERTGVDPGNSDSGVHVKKARSREALPAAFLRSYFANCASPRETLTPAASPAAPRRKSPTRYSTLRTP